MVLFLSLEGSLVVEGLFLSLEVKEFYSCLRKEVQEFGSFLGRKKMGWFCSCFGNENEAVLFLFWGGGEGALFLSWDKKSCPVSVFGGIVRQFCSCPGKEVRELCSHRWKGVREFCLCLGEKLRELFVSLEGSEGVLCLGDEVKEFILHVLGRK